MSVWIIYSEDGVELGRSHALLAKTAFLVWHKPAPRALREIRSRRLTAGGHRITYDGKTFVLRREPEI